jgi:hypothetical protein
MALPYHEGRRSQPQQGSGSCFRFSEVCVHVARLALTNGVLQCGATGFFRPGSSLARALAPKLRNVMALVWDGVHPVPHDLPGRRLQVATTPSSGDRGVRSGSRTRSLAADRNAHNTRAPVRATPRLFAVPYSTGLHYVPDRAPREVDAMVRRPLRPWEPHVLHAQPRPLLAAYIGAFRRGTDPSSMYWAVKHTVRT